VYDVRRGKPDFEKAAERARSRGSLLPVLVVLAFGVTLVVGLIALTGLAGIYIILAVSCVLGFAAMHYVLWGWWLTDKLRRQDESEREDP